MLRLMRIPFVIFVLLSAPAVLADSCDSAFRGPSIPILTEADDLRIAIALEKQLPETEKFVARLAAAMNQKMDRPFLFQKVEIRLRRETGQKLTLLDDTLVVGMPRNILLQPKVMNEFELRRLWDKGEHLDGNPRIKALWPFLNPVGVFRTQLRKLLGAKLQDLSARLDQIHSSSELLQFVRTSTHEELIESHLRERLEHVSDERVAEVVTAMKEVLTKQEFAEDVMDAGIAAGLDQMPDYDITNHSYGVTVGNIHDIAISLQPRYARYVRSVSKQDRPQVRVDAKGGLVSVFTIDRIHIHVDLNHIAETAALGEALGRL